MIRWTAPLAVVGAFVASSPVSAYPIDCAILLCMAGGFPANPHCAAAKAEVIRRITPWPIEPPLQIWRCPMNSGGSISGGATSGSGTGRDPSLTRFYDSMAMYDIDFAVRYRQTNDGDESCTVGRNRVRKGSYDQDGAFAWADVDPTALPEWIGWRPRVVEGCGPVGAFRAIGFRYEPIVGEGETFLMPY